MIVIFDLSYVFRIPADVDDENRQAIDVILVPLAHHGTASIYEICTGRARLAVNDLFYARYDDLVLPDGSNVLRLLRAQAGRGWQAPIIGQPRVDRS